MLFWTQNVPICMECFVLRETRVCWLSHAFSLAWLFFSIHSFILCFFLHFVAISCALNVFAYARERERECSWLCSKPCLIMFLCTFNVPKVYYIQLKQHKFSIEWTGRYFVCVCVCVHDGWKRREKSAPFSTLVSRIFLTFIRTALIFLLVWISICFLRFAQVLSILCSILFRFIVLFFCSLFISAHIDDTFVANVCSIHSIFFFIHCIKLVFVNMGGCLRFCCRL